MQEMRTIEEADFVPVLHLLVSVLTSVRRERAGDTSDYGPPCVCVWIMVACFTSTPCL